MITDARIEAACAYMYDVWGNDERDHMRGVLEAADEAGASLAQRLADQLAGATATVHAFNHGPGMLDRCNRATCRESRALIAEYDASVSSEATA